MLNESQASPESLPVGTIEELIQRLEKATGPDRELDLAIGEAIGAADHSEPAWHRPYRDWARHYTGTLDAALTLVPEGWDWGVSTSAMGPNVSRCFFASVRENQPIDPVTLQYPDRRDAEGSTHHRGGPALALCIAALKARLSTGTAPRATSESPQPKQIIRAKG